MNTFSQCNILLEITARFKATGSSVLLPSTLQFLGIFVAIYFVSEFLLNKISKYNIVMEKCKTGYAEINY